MLLRTCDFDFRAIKNSVLNKDDLKSNILEAVAMYLFSGHIGHKRDI
jgi:hypothetical protein